LLPDADFLPTTKKAVMILMENSIGTGENANGKESLFKCLPEKGVVAESLHPAAIYGTGTNRE
jgi:hypothetical protein